MEKPLKYSVFEKTESGSELHHETNTYCYFYNEGRFTTLVDTRYEAKLRLYNWWCKKNVIKQPEYNPFKGTEIGKTIPILNF